MWIYYNISTSFSRESDSRIANVRNSVRPSVRPIDHRPLRLSIIKPINLWSSFTTFKPFGLLEIVSGFQTLPFSFSNVIQMKFKIGGQLPIGGKSPSDIIFT